MSRIEQIITEIEDYIDSCKFQPLSNSKILVNKEEMEELLVELRMRVPEEIKKYQKIISNKDAILADAQTKADAMLADAAEKQQRLVDENEVMREAVAQSNALLEQTRKQAQEILDSATIEANNMRAAAMQYTDDILANIENLLTQTMKMTSDHYESFITALNQYNDVVNANRVELNPPEADEYIGQETAESEGTSEGLNLDLL